jgi:hypothetical protein
MMKCLGFIPIPCHHDINAAQQQPYGMSGARAGFILLTHHPLYFCSQRSRYSLSHCLLLQPSTFSYLRLI